MTEVQRHEAFIAKGGQATPPPPFPRTVTILGNGADSHGVKRCILDMATGLHKRGIAVNFLLHKGEGPLADGVNSGPWPVAVATDSGFVTVSGGGLRKFAGLIARALAQWRLAGELASEVRRHASDAILVCSPLETLAASIAARRTRRTAYWMMPNEVSDYPFDLNRRVYRAMFRRGNLVPLANSRFTDASLGLGDYRRRVCHLGIDPGEFDIAAPPGASRSQLGIPDDALVIGVFARMVENKGQLMLTRAIAALGEAAGNVHLMLCGGPLGTPYAARIVDAAQDLGIGRRVHLLGEQDDVAGYYRLCDIVANSRLDPEPFGLSVVEGMMLAKPVLAHRAGGPSETVIDGETGWLVPSPSLEDFAASLRRALTDRARWPEMGACARRRALETFTADHMVDRVLGAMRDFS